MNERALVMVMARKKIRPQPSLNLNTKYLSFIVTDVSNWRLNIMYKFVLLKVMATITSITESIDRNNNTTDNGYGIL